MSVAMRLLQICVFSVALLGCEKYPTAETHGVRVKTTGTWPKGVRVLVGTPNGNAGDIDVYLFSDAKIIGGSFTLLADGQHVKCNFSNFEYGEEVQRITVRAPSLAKSIGAIDAQSSLRYIANNVEALDFEGIVK